MAIEVVYWTNAPDDAYPTVLTLPADGDPRLEVGTNGDDPAVRTVGEFRKDGDSLDADLLRRAVSDPAFVTGPEAELVEPGTVVREVRVRPEEGPVYERVAAGDVAEGAAFRDAEEIALRIAAELRAHPERALEMAFSPEGGGGNGTGFDVRLSNPGSQAVAMPVPARWEERGVRLVLTFFRAGVTEAEMTNEDQGFVELSADALVPPLPPTPSPDLLAVPPGAAVRFSFRTEAPDLGGNREVEATFELPLLDAAGHERLRVELVSPRVAL